MNRWALRATFVVAAALLAASFAPLRARAAGDEPHPDMDYITGQLVQMSSSYLQRYSGFDGPPGDLDPAHGNQPPQVNGWQEFFAHWKQQLRDPAVLGAFAHAGAIADHPFDVNAFVNGAHPPFQGDVPVLTIPGATCPGQSTLIAGHPDGTPGLNTGNGSTYDDTSGITMGMGETQALARWWQAHGTWPARTFKLGMFDAEEVGLDGSQFYADNLIPPGPQGQYVLVANMDQNGIEYPAFPFGSTATTFNPGAWYTNINASPLKDFSIYSDAQGHPDPAILANMPAIQRFRAALAQSVAQAFSDLGAKYHFTVPLLGGGTAPAYLPQDIAAKSPVQDDTLGRTDQVPFVARGIPGFGVLGAYDSTANENPAYGLGPLAPLGDGSLVSIPQQAGYDTPRDNVAHFNLLTSGVPTPDAIGEPARRALELPATWTSYLLARPEYSGAAPTPQAPIAYFEALPVAPSAGAPVSFDASASVDDLDRGLQYTWDFGDGSHATGVAVRHSYASAGWYDAILVVRDAAGHAVGYREAVKVGDTKAAAPSTDPCGTVSSQDVSRVLSAAGASGRPGGALARCTAATGFRRVHVMPSRGGLEFSVSRRVNRPYTLEVFETSHGRTLVRNRRVFRRAGTRRQVLSLAGRHLPGGTYFARATMHLPGGRHDIRRVTLRRVHGRFTVVAPHYRRDSCGLLSSFKLSGPAFGGTRTAALGVAYRLGGDAAAVRVELLRGRRVVRHVASAGHEQAGLTYRLRVPARALRRAVYRVRITIRSHGRTVRATLASRRL